MTPEELLDAGQVHEALAALQQKVRAEAAVPKHRFFLFQLYCILGEWSKAMTQLNVAADMDSGMSMSAEVYRPLIQCEGLRADVFAGKQTPLIFGKPENWMGMMVQANAALGAGQIEEAATLRRQALRQATPIPGNVDSKPFAFLMDADSRLGPMLEVVLEGKYFWVPMSRIKRIDMMPPNDLQDLVWTKVMFTWSNNGSAAGFIPTRYPATTTAGDDPLLMLARKTLWTEQGPGCWLGLGQRLFAGDSGSFPILEIKAITLELPIDLEEDVIVGPGMINPAMMKTGDDAAPPTEAPPPQG
jgi:type VI secretion system protein ImpE